MLGHRCLPQGGFLCRKCGAMEEEGCWASDDDAMMDDDMGASATSRDSPANWKNLLAHGEENLCWCSMREIQFGTFGGGWNNVVAAGGEPPFQYSREVASELPVG